MKSFILYIIAIITLINICVNAQIDSPNDICGSDNRTRLNHPAVGRIYMNPGSVGTGWILYDGRIVTARHVVEGKSSGFIEFNVPNSTSCDEWGHPATTHKYTINISSIVKSSSTDIGNDWAIFTVSPSSGQTPI